MQNARYLSNWLSNHVNEERYLFSLLDLRALFPNLSYSAFKLLISRSVKSGYLLRMCRGLYIYNRRHANGLELFHAAAHLRANEFNYISLETALSEAGIISQIPVNRITIMTSGRSNVVSCGSFGTIEFVHTVKKPEEIKDKLIYDFRCKLWRASVSLALRDMKTTHRNSDLIDWDAVNEFI